MTGRPALRRGELGQAGNGAATAAYRKCRGYGSSPSILSLGLLAEAASSLAPIFLRLPIRAQWSPRYAQCGMRRNQYPLTHAAALGGLLAYGCLAGSQCLAAQVHVPSTRSTHVAVATEAGNQRVGPAFAPSRTSVSSRIATQACQAALQRYPLHVSLHLSKQGQGFDLRTLFFAPVSPRVAWHAMTDYDAMASYMPGMQRSEVLAESGNTLHVLQEGRAGIAPFRVNLRSQLTITLQRHAASWVTTGGNLDSRGNAYVSAHDGGSAVTYAAHILPRVWIPPLLGPWLMHAQLKRQMLALRGHMCALLSGQTVVTR